MKVKKNLSLEEDILNKGLVRAKDLGYNFSTYVTYLINQDCNGIEIKTVPKENKKKLDKESENSIDNILNL